MKHTLQIIITLFTAGIILQSCSSSRKTIAIEEGWEMIGESKAAFIRDRDEVIVTSPSTFTAIRFKVEEKPIRLKELNVVFQNGDKLAPMVDDVVEADQFSREISLGPEGRSIRSVEFSYRSKGNLLKGRAKVLIFAKRYVAPTQTIIR